LRRTVIDQNGERRFRFAQVAEKGTALSKVFRQIWYVDDRCDESRGKDRHISLSLVLRDKLIERFSMRRIERALGSGLVVQRPKFLADIPGHEEIAAGDKGTLPVIRNGSVTACRQQRC
jgi:hypothetical protein